MRRVVIAGACVLLTALGAAPTVDAQEEPPPDTTPDTTPDEAPTDVTGGDVTDGPPPILPLIPVPTGCAAPRMPHVVFVGEVVERDYRTIRFEIDKIRSGGTAPFASRGEIDVRYGLDAQYLDDGQSYLVSAVVDPDLGLLVSRVTEPIENFGGDEVIGVSETDVNCPEFEDPMRTLHLDGTPVESSVVRPFFDARIRILGAILLPLGLAFGAIFLLATFRLSVSGLYRSVVDASGRRFS